MSAALAACLAAGCASSPEPPAAPEGLDQLAERYEQPTAEVARSLVPVILERVPELDLVGATGLPVLREVIEDVNEAIREHDDLGDEVELEGTIDARRPCPGVATGIEAQGQTDVSGSMTVKLGVESSKLQRWLRGEAQACIYIDEASDGSTTQVTSTTRFEADLGQDVPLGQSLPTYLLARLRGMQATLVRGQEVSEFRRDEFHFRVTEAGTVEVLVDLATLDVGAEGTAVATLYTDGTRGLRTRDNEWRCGKTGRSCGQRR